MLEQIYEKPIMALEWVMFAHDLNHVQIIRYTRVAGTLVARDIVTTVSLASNDDMAKLIHSTVAMINSSMIEMGLKGMSEDED